MMEDRPTTYAADRSSAVMVVLHISDLLHAAALLINICLVNGMQIALGFVFYIGLCGPVALGVLLAIVGYHEEGMSYLEFVLQQFRWSFALIWGDWESVVSTFYSTLDVVRYLGRDCWTVTWPCLFGHGFFTLVNTLGSGKPLAR